MQDYLMHCYYDGMTILKALDNYAQAYNKFIPNESIEIAKKRIKKLTGKEWRY